MAWIDTGFGTQYQSPTGRIEDATQLRLPDGTVTNVVHNADGSLSYIAPPAPSGPAPATDQSAKGLIDTFLTQYGLASLSDWAWGKWQNGESIEQIMLELRGTPEYKARFPAMDALSAKGHAISESQYISLEQTYTQISRQFGLPSGFYDQPSDFTALISGEVSPAEYQERVQAYSTLAYEVDPATRDALRRLYGVDEGYIAAWAIDPEKALPTLQRQFGATQAAASAARSGWGELGLADAELISGVDQGQLNQGFSTLAANRELFNTLPGEAGSGIDTATQLSAAFLGDADAQATIERKARERAAVFGAGGSAQQTQKGYAGVG